MVIASKNNNNNNKELTWQQFVEVAVVSTLIQNAGEINRSGLSLSTLDKIYTYISWL